MRVLSIPSIPIPASKGKSTSYEARHKQAQDWPLVLASENLAMDGENISAAKIFLRGKGMFLVEHIARFSRRRSLRKTAHCLTCFGPVRRIERGVAGTSFVAERNQVGVRYPVRLAVGNWFSTRSERPGEGAHRWQET
jgi:hypothetical protein